MSNELDTTALDALAEETPFWALDEIGKKLFEHVVSHGFQGKHPDRDFLLFISEIIEAFEDERMGKTESDKLPGFTPLEEEMADLVIRVLTFSQEHKLRLAEAVEAKHAYNLTRPFKHGKKF